MKTVYILLLPFLFLASYAFSTTPGMEEDTAFPNSELITEVADIQHWLMDSNTVLIDMRGEGYIEGHIPGAVWFGGIPALVDADHAVEHFLVDGKTFQQLMRTVGVNQDSHILIYDDGNGLGASRLFYALSLYGHDKATVVNGGFAAWSDQQFPVETEGDIPSPGNFTVSLNESRSCDVSYLTGNLDRDDLVVIDARSPEEYSGTEKRSERSGHIPGAVNLEWSNFVMDEGIPYFKPPAQIAQMLEEKGITPDKEVITHCQTNVRGSHVFFTLRLMGYDSLRAYEGSWFEWGNRADTPISGE